MAENIHFNTEESASPEINSDNNDDNEIRGNRANAGESLALEAKRLSKQVQQLKLDIKNRESQAMNSEITIAIRSDSIAKYMKGFSSKEMEVALSQFMAYSLGKGIPLVNVSATPLPEWKRSIDEMLKPYLCVKCGLLPLKPSYCMPCDSHFCYKCMDETKASDNQCPSLREHRYRQRFKHVFGALSFRSLSFYRNQLTISCPYGCVDEERHPLKLSWDEAQKHLLKECEQIVCTDCGLLKLSGAGETHNCLKALQNFGCFTVAQLCLQQSNEQEIIEKLKPKLELLLLREQDVVYKLDAEIKGTQSLDRVYYQQVDVITAVAQVSRKLDDFLRSELQSQVLRNNIRTATTANRGRRGRRAPQSFAQTPRPLSYFQREFFH